MLRIRLGFASSHLAGHIYCRFFFMNLILSVINFCCLDLFLVLDLFLLPDPGLSLYRSRNTFCSFLNFGTGPSSLFGAAISRDL